MPSSVQRVVQAYLTRTASNRAVQQVYHVFASEVQSWGNAALAFHPHSSPYLLDATGEVSVQFKIRYVEPGYEDIKTYYVLQVAARVIKAEDPNNPTMGVEVSDVFSSSHPISVATWVFEVGHTHKWARDLSVLWEKALQKFLRKYPAIEDLG